MRTKTWKVLKWVHPQTGEADGTIELACPKCERDAHIPTSGHPGVMIIAAFGLALITDPPGVAPRKDWMPDEIQCRGCRTIWTSDPIEDEELLEEPAVDAAPGGSA